jgi:hypothetical protein
MLDATVEESSPPGKELDLFLRGFSVGVSIDVGVLISVNGDSELGSLVPDLLLSSIGISDVLDVRNQAQDNYYYSLSIGDDSGKVLLFLLRLFFVRIRMDHIRWLLVTEI